MTDHEDEWTAYNNKQIREAHIAFRTSPGYARAVEIAASKGYRPASLYERMYAPPTDIYTSPSTGGVWCKAE
jgi:hypothetical protein